MADDDKRDPPIENPGFVGGVNVVDIGDLRVARGFSRRPYSACRHLRQTYDSQERRIWCQDCERTIETFDAYTVLVEHIDTAIRSLDRRTAEVAEAEKFSLRALATKALDKVWRGRMIPACPQCGGGLFPEDFKHGVQTTLGRDYAEALRKSRTKKP